MSEQPKIAKIGVTIDGGDYSAEGLRVTLAVGTIPTVALSVVRKSAPTVSHPMSAEVVASIKKRQKERLAGKKEPDVTINISDGVGGKMQFKGFQVAPVLDITTTSIADQFSVLGVDGVLDALDLGIYQAGSEKQRKETAAGSGPLLDPIPAAKEGNVAKLARGITEVLVKNYGASLDKESHPSIKQLMEQQHAINSGLPLEVWYKILDNSDVVYETWAAAAKDYEYIGSNITERMKLILTQRVGGFWNIANELMASFQMYYVPSTSGSGKFVRADRKVNGPTTPLDVSASSISLADGSFRMLPPGGVVMMMPASVGARDESGYMPGTSSVAAQYPDPLVYGFIQREMPPAWLVNDKGMPVLGSELDKVRAKAKRPLDLNLKNLVARQTGVKDLKADADTTSSGIMTELCEVMFKEIQLAHSTAVVTTPLDLMVPIGVRVTVNIKGGGGTFEAFVNGLMHSVDLKQGKELNSFTQISLTHCTF